MDKKYNIKQVFDDMGNRLKGQHVKAVFVGTKLDENGELKKYSVIARGFINFKYNEENPILSEVIMSVAAHNVNAAVKKLNINNSLEEKGVAQIRLPFMAVTERLDKQMCLASLSVEGRIFYKNPEVLSEAQTVTKPFVSTIPEIFDETSCEILQENADKILMTKKLRNIL